MLGDEDGFGFFADMLRMYKAFLHNCKAIILKQVIEPSRLGSICTMVMGLGVTFTNTMQCLKGYMLAIHRKLVARLVDGSI